MIKVHNLTKLPYGKLPLKEGVIFCTYAALVSKSARQTRLDQLVTWLGGSKAEGANAMLGPSEPSLVHSKTLA